MSFVVSSPDISNWGGVIIWQTYLNCFILLYFRLLIEVKHEKGYENESLLITNTNLFAACGVI